jgi:hypothetical protein
MTTAAWRRPIVRLRMPLATALARGVAPSLGGTDAEESTADASVRGLRRTPQNDVKVGQIIRVVAEITNQGPATAALSVDMTLSDAANQVGVECGSGGNVREGSWCVYPVVPKGASVRATFLAQALDDPDRVVVGNVCVRTLDVADPDQDNNCRSFSVTTRL